MMFNVPQFVDIEDKVAGPLTWKQLLWMIAMGVLLLVMWNTLTFGTFIGWAIPIIIIFVAFAFYRPYNQPLTKMVYHGILYFFNPKVYTWKREMQKNLSAPEKKQKKPDQVEVLSLDEIQSLAKNLDDPDKALLEKRKQ
jgi:hypothetical protein